MSRAATLSVALALLLATACATSGEQRSSRSSTHIIQPEISESSASNAYDLIQSLRPRWLTTRGQPTLATTRRQTDSGTVTEMARTTVMVYVDGSRVGEVDELRNIWTRDIASIQRLSAGEATQRFGGNHPHGAILISTR